MSVAHRFPLVDALRGLAIVMMLHFHFSYDLTYFGMAQWNFYADPFWLHYRTLILSTFLFVMGMSLHLAHASVLHWPAFRRRLLILLGCAALVSLGSFALFRERVIVFGILHFISVASLLGLVFLRFYWVNLFAGIGLLWLGNELALEPFNQPWLHWLGLMTHKPQTEDYVPLLPWFGVVLIGMFFARFAVTQANIPPLRRERVASPVQALARLGQHSLLIYMVHQPVFFGLLFLVKSIWP